MRGSRWHRDRTHDGSGILARHHTCRCALHQEHQQHDRTRDNTEGEPFLLDEEQHLLLVFRQQGVVSGIEGGVETADECALLFTVTLIVRLQEDRTQCRTQRQGVQGGKTDRDRHCQTELAIEDTRCTAHEGHRDEHGHHDQRDGDDRTTQLVHGVDGSQLSRLIALIQLRMDALDDDDRIIDHNRDGQHQRTKGQEVQAKADHRKQEEGTDQGHRNRNGRDQGRTHILQEDINHDEHQDKGLDQGLEHLVDRGEQEVVGVHGDVDLQARRQCRLLLFQQGLDVANGLCRIRSCHLEDDTGHGIMTIHLVQVRIGLTTQLHISDILQAQHLSVGQSLDDDVLKLFRLLQTTFVSDRVLEGLIALLTKLTGSRLDVLLRQGRCHIIRHQTILRHNVRLQPDTHGVV